MPYELTIHKVRNLLKGLNNTSLLLKIIFVSFDKKIINVFVEKTSTY